MMNSTINKSVPRKVEFNYYLRGFICPTCFAGTYNGNHTCSHYGQVLADAYDFGTESTDK